MKKMKTTNESCKTRGNFVPNIKNFEVSLSYEGITARDKRVAVSLESLKLKYAR